MNEIHIREHPSPIKNWKQLLVVAVLSFAAPVFLIVATVQIITGGLAVDPTSLAMSEEAVAARLKPVGQVRLAGTAAAVAAPASMVANAQPVAAASAKPKSGEEVYQQVCTVCHGAGIAGAPKTGDKAAWKPRIAQGIATLYEHAIKGKGAMPPKGGAASASDAEVKAAVDYLVSQGK